MSGTVRARASANQEVSPSRAVSSVVTTGGTERDRIRSFLMARLRRMMAARQLTQAQAARWFQISQPRVSHLVNDRANRFSTDTLFNMLGHAGVRVSVDFKDGSVEVVVPRVQNRTDRCRARQVSPAD
jgi:predicted XRE-type DNA-binding protein